MPKHFNRRDNGVCAVDAGPIPVAGVAAGPICIGVGVDAGGLRKGTGLDVLFKIRNYNIRQSSRM